MLRSNTGVPLACTEAYPCKEPSSPVTLPFITDVLPVLLSLTPYSFPPFPRYHKSYIHLFLSCVLPKNTGSTMVWRAWRHPHVSSAQPHVGCTVGTHSISVSVKVSTFCLGEKESHAQRMICKVQTVTMPGSTLSLTPGRRNSNQQS